MLRSYFWAQLANIVDGGYYDDRIMSFDDQQDHHVLVTILNMIDEIKSNPRCPNHIKYKGIKAPKCSCTMCAIIYDRNQRKI